MQNTSMQRPCDESGHGLKETIKSQFDWSQICKGKSCIKSGEADMELTVRKKPFQTGTILRKLCIILMPGSWTKNGNFLGQLKYMVLLSI